jgi:hypothetical protein
MRAMSVSTQQNSHLRPRQGNGLPTENGKRYKQDMGWQEMAMKPDGLIPFYQAGVKPNNRHNCLIMGGVDA